MRLSSSRPGLVKVGTYLISLALLVGGLAVGLVAGPPPPVSSAAPLARPYEGSLDLSFNPGAGATSNEGAPATVYAIALQADGKVLIGGTFEKYNGTPRIGIARLNANGSLDTTFASKFAPGSGPSVNAIAIQPDGKILIGGSFTTYDGKSRNSIARLTTDGSLDTTFAPVSGVDDGNLAAIVVQPSDGKILIAGNFSRYDSTTRNYVARLNTNGSLDSNPATGFNPGVGPDGYLDSLALQADGKVLIGGYFNCVGGTYNGTSCSGGGSVRHHLARLNSTGALDNGFDPGAIGGEYGQWDRVFAIVPQADGKVLYGGNFGWYGAVPHAGVARANANGTLDTSFDPGDNVSETRSLARDRHGRAVVGGGYYNLTRLNSDGSLDASFDPGEGANGQVFAQAIQPDGKILIAGSFDSYDGTSRPGVARVNAYGYDVYLPLTIRPN